MGLFDVEFPDADLGYLNINKAEHPIEAQIKESLEALWLKYEPYADADFTRQFSLQPDARFWEMYLTTELLNQGRSVCPRAERPAATRDVGPDIRIQEGEQTIWIEAIAPKKGDLQNLDRVPELVPIGEDGIAMLAPRRQVELRITGALCQKLNAFNKYRDEGHVAEHDLCMIAISGTHFYAQSGSLGLPCAVTAVYPIGDQYITLDRDSFEVVDTGYHHSLHIDRSAAEPIPRYAFLHNSFSAIAGLIWSRRTIGNFMGQGHDFVLVHNASSFNRFPTGWIDWAEEFSVADHEQGYGLTRICAQDGPD